MDLLERARTLEACPLFENLAPAVLIRLAERARVTELERGERRSTDEDVWVVVAGSFAVVVREGLASDPTAFATASIARKRGAVAVAGNALGLVRVVRPATRVVEVVAEVASVLVGLSVDDVRDVLEEDPSALAAIADRLAALLLEGAG
jgi:CRP-like cAMP-binding protein